MSRNGKHGNSTHGIWAAATRLRKGQAFDGYMQELYLEVLSRRGLEPADLNTLGAVGDVIRHTARAGVVAELVWSGLLMAASTGDVGGFYAILKEHGHRLGQVVRLLHQEIEMRREQPEVYDYEQILAEERSE